MLMGESLGKLPLDDGESVVVVMVLLGFVLVMVESVMVDGMLAFFDCSRLDRDVGKLDVGLSGTFLANTG